MKACDVTLDFTTHAAQLSILYFICHTFAFDIQFLLFWYSIQLNPLTLCEFSTEMKYILRIKDFDGDDKSQIWLRKLQSIALGKELFPPKTKLWKEKEEKEICYKKRMFENYKKKHERI